jgi:aminoglycoside phosphotransferase (APT) family kinase protein|uniref:Aminoglycoside phosphotransferase family protein n=1 Tax=candidate division WOR-3 bacterium TaxID=2052148 RepID=A0A7C6AFN9_UNCW3
MRYLDDQNKNDLTENQLKITKILRREGLLNGQDKSIRFIPLSGGVSSDIFLVTDGKSKVVLKQALEKLRVRDDWYADVTRNRFEHEYLRYVSKLDKTIVPEVLYFNDEMGFFVMEYLDDFRSWKSDLLNKKLSKKYARKAGEILGNIHRISWNDKELFQKFDTTKQFIQLRVDPYFYTAGKKNVEFLKLFEQEGKRLIQHRKCLVHGDYSPKNLLVKNDRMVIIDSEVAWYGDPTFDVCFLLNHLFLKAIYNDELAPDYMELASEFWDTYMETLGKEHLADIERYVGMLLLMLMIARVDGKSPVEYITDERKKQIIRTFVKTNLGEDFSKDPVQKISNIWTKTILEECRRG